ncbi:MAG: CaiB/BaiF CoA-transferase family protein [Gordonia sp. (in: high G+C Gram-positive bacteria)]
MTTSTPDSERRPSGRSGPLASIRVIEFAGIGPGPHAAMLLADLGADVIRVQRPGQLAAEGVNADALLRGRRVVEANLKNPADRETLLNLVAKADVVIEGFRPGVMERLGFGPDDLAEVNPSLIYGRMTGWGQDGPRAPLAGHDMNYIALTGMLHAIGRKDEKPTPPLNLVGDFGGGSMFLVVGVLAALVERNISGKGEVIDAAMVDGASVLGQMMWAFLGTGMWRNQRGVNFLDTGAPFYEVYETSDGKWMSVGSIEPQFYAILLEKLEIDPDSLGFQIDPGTWPQTKERFTEVFKTKTRDEWTAIFDGTDACVAPILDWAEAPNDPHLAARGTLVEIDGVMQAQVAPRFSRSATETPTGPARTATDPATVWQD